MKSTPYLLLTAALVASCSSTPDTSVSDAAWQKRSDAIAIEASAVAHAAARDLTLDEAELAIWNDPDFKRRFIESYLSETDVEPLVTSTEREDMQEILDLISADRTGEAEALLIEKGGPAASAVFDFTLANIYFQQERLEEAAEAYLHAVEKFPKFRRAWQNLGLIYVRLSMFEEAQPAFTRVVESGGGSGLVFGLLGYCYTNQQDSLAAESAYRMAIILDPVTIDWKMGLARSLFELKRYADAAALCDTLIAAQPERADLWLLQANAYIGLGQPLRAAENYELVEELGGSTVDSLNMLGDIYVNEELYELAVQSYVRAMEVDENSDVERPIRAAQVLTARGALEESDQLLDQLDLLRGDVLGVEEKKQLLKLRARAAVARGAGDEEAAILERIVELDPLDGEALILLGQHSTRQGDVDRAIFYFELASGIEQFEADAKVRHAQVLVGERRYAEALPLLRRAQTLQPRDHVQDYLEQVERVSKGR